MTVDNPQMIHRAVRGLKNLGQFHYPEGQCIEPHELDCCLWGRVARVFGVGSTTAIAMCRSAGEDPDYKEDNHD